MADRSVALLAATRRRLEHSIGFAVGCVELLNPIDEVLVGEIAGLLKQRPKRLVHQRQAVDAGVKIGGVLTKIASHLDLLMVIVDRTRHPCGLLEAHVSDIGDLVGEPEFGGAITDRAELSSVTLSTPRGRGGIGRHARFRSWCSNECGGSSPPVRTFVMSPVAARSPAVPGVSFCRDVSTF